MTATTPLPTESALPAATGNANWRRFRRNPGAMVGLVLLALLVSAALLGPALTGDPAAQNLGARLQAPSSSHPLGTDQLGRDVLARVLNGARISLGLGVSVMLASLLVGSVVGLVAGLRGGWWDEGLMRVTDIFLAFPGLILAMAISAALGPSLTVAAGGRYDALATQLLGQPVSACGCMVRPSRAWTGASA